MNLKETIEGIARDAKQSARVLAKTSTTLKNEVLTLLADRILQNQDRIISTNQQDVIEARQKSLSPAMIDRMTFNPKRIQAMADGLKEVVALPDPVG
jgi:glutamate-5-semialdehyde dehydrogenase